MATSIPVISSHIRPLNVRRDLLPVADLIELCFHSSMDPDGSEYVRQIRRTARNFTYLRWVAGANERVSYPLHGYVWEQDGRVVGNLSLIPFRRQNQWRYLIANVAVHPDYRRRGIGRQLTERALQHLRDHGVKSAWLQVRDDNPVAIKLYQSLGFRERVRRSTWLSREPNHTDRPSALSSVVVTNRYLQDWPQQEAWLREIYPPEVSWNLAINIERYKPSVWQFLLQILNGERIEHWAARHQKQLLGLASWEASSNRIDNLWLACDLAGESLALPALLAEARARVAQRRTLVINYPAGRAAQIFRDSGFELQNTLIWMEAQL